MLGRKDHKPEELDHAKAAIGQQLAAHGTLVQGHRRKADGPGGRDCPTSSRSALFNSMVLALDRPLSNDLGRSRAGRATRSTKSRCSATR